jgi:hypothetical protein
MELEEEARSASSQTFALSGNAEVLAGESSCPNIDICWNTGVTETKRESSDTSEEVTLPVSSEFIGLHICDTPIVYHGIGELSP